MYDVRWVPQQWAGAAKTARICVRDPRGPSAFCMNIHTYVKQLDASPPASAYAGTWKPRRPSAQVARDLIRDANHAATRAEGEPGQGE